MLGLPCKMGGDVHRVPRPQKFRMRKGPLKGIPCKLLSDNWERKDAASEAQAARDSCVDRIGVLRNTVANVAW